MIDIERKKLRNRSFVPDTTESITEKDSLKCRTANEVESNGWEIYAKQSLQKPYGRPELRLKDLRCFNIFPYEQIQKPLKEQRLN